MSSDLKSQHSTRTRRVGVRRRLMLCMLFLGLTGGCSTPPPSSGWQESELQTLRFSQAKDAYLSENYALAASLLRPLAEHGHTQAQYALGYMYYYGQGMTRDENEAIRWLRAAAGQGDQLALEALTMLASHSPKEPQTAVLGAAPPPAAGATLIRPHAAPTQVENYPLVTEPANAREELPVEPANGPAWLRAQNPDYFTLQLLSSETEDGVKTYLRQQTAAEDARYVRTMTPQGERFAVLYGAYATYDLARAAAAGLPARLRTGEPWIRRIGSVLESLR